MEREMTRDEILHRLISLSAEMGRTPNKVEFLARTAVRDMHLSKHFGGWRKAVEASGLTPNFVPIGTPDDLLDDWGKLTRGLGHRPRLWEYRRRGKYGLNTFRRTFQNWPDIGRVFYARSEHDPRWQDVIEIIRNRSIKETTPAPFEARPRIMSPPPSFPYGEPLNCAFLRNAPVNEAGVVYLFGCVAAKLGYIVEAIQTTFPDCEAKRKEHDGRLRRVRIEFEFESRNFKLHGHDEKGADVIVCWRHNWEDCPLEVVELKTKVG